MSLFNKSAKNVGPNSGNAAQPPGKAMAAKPSPSSSLSRPPGTRSAAVAKSTPASNSIKAPSPTPAGPPSSAKRAEKPSSTIPTKPSPSQASISKAGVHASATKTAPKNVAIELKPASPKTNIPTRSQQISVANTKSTPEKTATTGILPADEVKQADSIVHISAEKNENVATLVDYYGIRKRRFDWFLRSKKESHVPCPYTGLTPAEKRAMQDNWKLIHRDLKGNSVELFVRYFVEHKEFCAIFPGMTNARDLHKIHTVRKHSQQAMELITCAIDNVWQPENIEPLLMRIGRNHAHYNCPPQSFTALPHVCVDFLEYKLGKLLSNNMVGVWSRFFDGMMSIIIKGLLSESEWQKKRVEQNQGAAHLGTTISVITTPSPIADEDSSAAVEESAHNVKLPPPPPPLRRRSEEEQKVDRAVEVASAIYMRQMSERTHEKLFPVKREHAGANLSKNAAALVGTARQQWVTAAKQARAGIGNVKK